MKYRKLPNGKENISVLGLGCGYIDEANENEIIETLETAVKNGINYFDCAASSDKPFSIYGKVLSQCRKNIYLQIHFGAEYSTGEYGWTTDLEKIKKSIEWQMENLKTDYIDFGFIHCIDEEADLNEIMSNGVLKYILSLKDNGTIHHIALSTHDPSLANKVLDMNIIDLMMFSINPAYDYGKGDEMGNGTAEERMNLYRRCESKKVGISVMKAFAGGQLLDEKISPFICALTPYQLIQYVLDKPGVLTVLPGIRGKADLENLLGFFSAKNTEKDYSVLAEFTPAEIKNKCVYCSHCQPCPAGLSIALINKYYDLAKCGDKLAREHYLSLDKKSSKCISCGHCNLRCPFGVDQRDRMKEIEKYFGI